MKVKLIMEFCIDPNRVQVNISDLEQMFIHHAKDLSNTIGLGAKTEMVMEDEHSCHKTYGAVWFDGLGEESKVSWVSY